MDILSSIRMRETLYTIHGEDVLHSDEYKHLESLLNVLGNYLFYML